MIKPRSPESLFSGANLITLARLLASLTFFSLAVLWQKEIYNYVGLAVHWAGDLLDGFWARLFRQRTVLGAEMDIIADRVETLFFFLNFINFHPQLVLPVVVYIINFAFVDFYLSYQFIKFDLISIDYFYLVDKKVYKLNFSRPGKFVNSTVVPLILIVWPAGWLLAIIITVGLIIIKIHSVWLLWQKREIPE